VADTDCDCLTPLTLVAWYVNVFSRLGLDRPKAGATHAWYQHESQWPAPSICSTRYVSPTSAVTGSGDRTACGAGGL